MDSESDPIPRHTIHVDDLLGRTFLLPTEENGEQHCTKIISRVKEIRDQDGKQVENIKLLDKLNTKDQAEELKAYNQVMDIYKGNLKMNSQENKQSSSEKFRTLGTTWTR